MQSLYANMSSFLHLSKQRYLFFLCYILLLLAQLYLNGDFCSFHGWKTPSLSSCIFRLEFRKTSSSTEELPHFHPSLIPFPFWLLSTSLLEIILLSQFSPFLLFKFHFWALSCSHTRKLFLVYITTLSITIWDVLLWVKIWGSFSFFFFQFLFTYLTEREHKHAHAQAGELGGQGERER